MGIEPTSEAWEALNKTLKAIDLAALRFFEKTLKSTTVLHVFLHLCPDWLEVRAEELFGRLGSNISLKF